MGHQCPGRLAGEGGASYRRHRVPGSQQIARDGIFGQSWVNFILGVEVLMPQLAHAERGLKALLAAPDEQ